DTKSFPVIVLAVTVGLLLHGAMYGPQAAFISEMFDTKVRYSGASMGSQLASIIGGALAPIIAVELLKDHGSSVPISLYLCFASVVTAVTVWIAKETRGRDLAKDGLDGSVPPAPATATRKDSVPLGR
ncbi:MFS transporter, partial [Streptomyces rubiginosohelvolus]